MPHPHNGPERPLVPERPLPPIIQGGMGAGVSDWRLARAVAQEGQMGVVSGTALDTVLARRLQQGDPGGHLRRALAAFPWPHVAEAYLSTHLIPGGKAPDVPYRLLPMPTIPLPRERVEALIVANYCEVWLAKEGHEGPVGINYLEKIQLPNLPSLLGAVLAGVDYVLMGGGIPLAIPGILERLARWEPVEMAIHVEGLPAEHADVARQRLDPGEVLSGTPPPLARPRFLAIVSSDVVAKTMLRRGSGTVDGFVVEDFTAGGHNAPPRRRAAPGEAPGFGEADVPRIEAIRALGRPFWLAGSCASPERLREAQAAGACGVQVGTAFGLCEESAIAPAFKRATLARWHRGEHTVGTDFRASPTGYPFKVAALPGTLADPALAAARERICDLGYLRECYWREDGRLGYRCPSEPRAAYLAKGGAPERIEGSQCLCNGLMGTIGLAQVRPGGEELALVTSGEDLGFLAHLAPEGAAGYTAADVVRYLLG
jgi:nitronate monooxygenase